MSRGERLLGPKRNTRRGKREHRRERNEARKAKRIESEIESERDERWERLPSENDRHEFTSSQPCLERLYRLLPEKKRSVFSRYD